MKVQFLEQESNKLFPEKVKFKKRDYHFRTEVVRIRRDKNPFSLRSITELHEINVKFNAKQLKPQLPHFRMALGASDNPTYYGILLDSVLGIIAQKRGDPDGPELGVIVVEGYQPRGPSVKVSNQLLIGDIVRSMDGQHVTLESVNAFLVNKVYLFSVLTASFLPH